MLKQGTTIQSILIETLSNRFLPKTNPKNLNLIAGFVSSDVVKKVSYPNGGWHSDAVNMLKKAKTTRWITSSREDSRNSRQYLKISITKIENGANLMVIWSTFDPRIHGLVLTSWEIIALEDRLLPKQQSISHLRHPALPRRNRRSKQSIESRFATQGSGARVYDIDEQGL